MKKEKKTFLLPATADCAAQNWKGENKVESRSNFIKRKLKYANVSSLISSLYCIYDRIHTILVRACLLPKRINRQRKLLQCD